MVFKGLIAAVSAVALTATPALATASQSAAAARAATELAPAEETVEGSELRGGFIIPVIVIVAIILGILAATKGNGENPPVSP